MKNPFKTFILFGLIFICIQQTESQTDRSKKPRSKPAPDLQIGKTNTFTLQNGMRVYLVENHKLPVITYSFFVYHDPVIEKEYAGMRSYTYQLLGTATKTLSKDEIDIAVDFIGSTLSVNENEIYASTLRKHNEKLLALLSDILINAVFTNEELDKIKQQNIAALLAKFNDPDFIASRIMKAIIFGKEHPYGELEQEYTLANITLDQCINYYNTYIRPQNIHLAIVGDITLAEAEQLVSKYFEKWEAGIQQNHTYNQPRPPSKRQIIVIDRPDAVQSVIKVCYPIDFKIGQTDYFPGLVANTILGGSSNRLFLNLRETHGFTYGSYSNLQYDPLCGYFEAYASVRNSVTDSAIHEILSEMNRIIEQATPEFELQLVKNNLAGSFALSLESPETVARFAIKKHIYQLPDDYFIKYLSQLEKINSGDVMAAARRIILPGQCYIIVVGKAEEIIPLLHKFSFDGKIHQYDVEGNLLRTH